MAQIVTDEEIIHMFTVQKRSPRQIPAHRMRIARVLDAAGIPRRKQHKTPPVAAILEMDVQGHSQAKIARTLKVSPYTVRKVREQAGRVVNLSDEPLPERVPFEPVTMPVLKWEQDHKGWFGGPDIQEMPAYQGESRLRAKLNARRQEQEATA